MKRLSIILFLITLLMIDGCVPSRPTFEEVEYTSSRLIKKLEANRRKVKTFRGTGVINVVSPKIEAKASFEVILKKPDSLKISIYGPFGIDLAQASVTNNKFMFYDALRNNLYEGGISDNVLQKIFKVNISFDDLMDAFAGSVNLTDKLGSEPDNYIVNEDHYLLTYIDSLKNTKTLFRINIGDLAITDYELSALDGKTYFEGNYSDFKDFEQVAVPFRSIVQNKNDDQKLDISYRSVEINEPTEKIEIIVPSDVNRVIM